MGVVFSTSQSAKLKSGCRHPAVAPSRTTFGPFPWRRSPPYGPRHPSLAYPPPRWIRSLRPTPPQNHAADLRRSLMDDGTLLIRPPALKKIWPVSTFGCLFGLPKTKLRIDIIGHSARTFLMGRRERSRRRSMGACEGGPGPGWSSRSRACVFWAKRCGLKEA